MYVDGFVIPVPAAKKEEFIAFARQGWPLFKEFGALRIVECWGDDVPKGKVTDFQSAVKATDDEVVVFAFAEWPSRAVRDEAYKKMMADPRMQDPKSAPFDGKRMIYGGFTPVVDER